MISVMPGVFLDADLPSKPMARNGVLLGWSTARAVWRFGFKPDSDMARAFLVSAPCPLFVLACHTGRTLETVSCRWEERLPVRFLKVFEARL